MITFRALRLWRRGARPSIGLGHGSRLRLRRFRALLLLCFSKLPGRFLRFFIQPLDFSALVLGLRSTIQLVIKASELNTCVAEIWGFSDGLLEQADGFGGGAFARLEKSHLVEC